MTLQQIFEKIEGIPFSSEVNVASGFRVFQRALEINETTQAFIRYLQEHPEHKHAVLQRLIDLLEKNDKPEYAHPYDAALAGYLYVLKVVDPQMALKAAKHALRTPKLWWARKQAEYILKYVIKPVKISSSSRALPIQYHVYERQKKHFDASAPTTYNWGGAV